MTTTDIFYPTSHGVVSDLGVTLLADALAPENEVAQLAALEMLVTPKDGLVSAVGAWSDSWRPEVLLPSAVDYYHHIPSSEEFSAWVESASLGIIKQASLPASNIDSLLASVVATDVKWKIPFNAIYTPREMSFWKSHKVLSAKSPFIMAFSYEGNLYVSTTTHSEEGLQVISVIAVDPNASSKTVIRAASAFSENRLDPAISIVDLNDIFTSQGDQNLVRVNSLGTNHLFLPAWESNTNIDLSSDPRVKRLGEWLKESTQKASGVEAIQQTQAQFNAKGFKAAALTMAFTRSSMQISKNYDVFFHRPYAVVAKSPSYGIAFQGWITESAEAED